MSSVRIAGMGKRSAGFVIWVVKQQLVILLL
ncbi:hypothetical protein LINPERPRIM_LOCUS18391 [Linum perenne]